MNCIIAHIFDSHTLVIRIFRQFLTAIWRIIHMMTGKTLSFSPQIGSIGDACLHLITQTNSNSHTHSLTLSHYLSLSLSLWSLLVLECVLCYVIIWGNRNAILSDLYAVQCLLVNPRRTFAGKIFSRVVQSSTFIVPTFVCFWQSLRTKSLIVNSTSKHYLLHFGCVNILNADLLQYHHLLLSSHIQIEWKFANTNYMNQYFNG